MWDSGSGCIAAESFGISHEIHISYDIRCVGFDDAMLEFNQDQQLETLFLWICSTDLVSQTDACVQVQVCLLNVALSHK